MEKAKEGDKFIKPDSKRVYVVIKTVINGDWVVLEEENSDHQILTSQDSLNTWIKYKKEEGK